MNPLLPKFLDVNMMWAMRHAWACGQCYQDPDESPMYSLWLFLEGEARVTIGGREWQVGAGTASLWPVGARRDIATPHGARWLSVRLNATLWGHMDLLQLLWPPVVWHPGTREFALLQQTMEALVDEWAGPTTASFTTPDTMDSYLAQHFSTWYSRDTTSVLLCDAYARTVVGLCWRMLAKVDLEGAADSQFPSWMTPVLQHLRAEPDIPIERLAHDAGISPTQLRRQFQKWFGAAPREYINRLRLDEARQLLESSELSAQEIAERIGFLSLSHFNRAFKTTFGMPPARYRQISRSNNS